MSSDAARWGTLANALTLSRAAAIPLLVLAILNGVQLAAFALLEVGNLLIVEGAYRRRHTARRG